MGREVYPRIAGQTADGYTVWEDEPGQFWLDDPANPGAISERTARRLLREAK